MATYSNPEHIKHSFRKAAQTYHKEAFFQKHSREQLMEHLFADPSYLQLSGEEAHILDLGCGINADTTLAFLQKLEGSLSAASTAVQLPKNLMIDLVDLLPVDFEAIRQFIKQSPVFSFTKNCDKSKDAELNCASQAPGVDTTLHLNTRSAFSPSSATLLERRALIFYCFDQANKVTKITLRSYADDVSSVLAEILESESYSIYKVILSNCMMQWLSNKEAFLSKVRQALHPQGVFLFSAHSEGNFIELASKGLSALPYLSQEQWNDLLLTQGFNPLVAPYEVVETKSFPSFLDIMRHLRETGVNALPANDKLKAKGKIESFAKDYEQSFSKDGQTYLTYKAIIAVAKRK